MLLHIVIVFASAASLSVVVYMIWFVCYQCGFRVISWWLCGCLLTLLTVCFDFSLDGFSSLDLICCYLCLGCCALLF